MKSANLLLEICETTFSFEKEYEDLASFEEIDSKAYAQRMRFVEEFGKSRQKFTKKHLYSLYVRS